MKKGFTLVELLMVVVIVGIFVAIALPQYRRASERGRMMEGLTNLRATVDYLNTQYLLADEETYPTSINTNSLDLVTSKYFELPVITSEDFDTEAEIVVARKAASGWGYQFYAKVQNGELTSSVCQNTGATDYCTQIGFHPSPNPDPLF